MDQQRLLSSGQSFSEWVVVGHLFQSYQVIRILDVAFALAGIVLGAPVMLLLCLAGYFDTGSPLLRQQRVGKNGHTFVLVKFRTMRTGTGEVATHLADAGAITPLGRILRRTKLDELPQLWNVLKGEMSLVGPRPCLPGQKELIGFRKARGVLRARPGITGRAQIRGIDMSTPELLASTDAVMMDNLSVCHYLYYILMTVSGKGMGDRVKEQ